jgi:hypothetical protein
MRHPSVTMVMGVLLLGAPGAQAVGVAVGGFGGCNIPILPASRSRRVPGFRAPPPFEPCHPPSGGLP